MKECITFYMNKFVCMLFYINILAKQMQKYYDPSQEFYFPSTQEIEEFQVIKMTQSHHQCLKLTISELFDPLIQKSEAIQQLQKKEFSEKYVKFNHLLNTIRQTNEQLQQTIATQTSKQQAQIMMMTKLKVNLKNFALTEVQLKYLIFLQQKYHQIQKKRHVSKEQNQQPQRKNLVEVKKQYKNQQSHRQNPRQFKVNW